MFKCVPHLTAECWDTIVEKDRWKEADAKMHLLYEKKNFDKATKNLRDAMHAKDTGPSAVKAIAHDKVRAEKDKSTTSKDKAAIKHLWAAAKKQRAAPKISGPLKREK